MKIIFVTENLGSGGAERQLTRLATLFKNAGHDVCVITWGSQQFHADYLREHKIEHITIPNYPKVKRVYKLALLYRRYKADAVISYLPMANKTAIFARFIYPIRRLIVSERSFTRDWGKSTKFQYWLYRFADYVVPNSFNEGRNIVENCPGLTKKVIPIPNFVEIERFQPEKHEIGRPIRIVSVGRVIPTKNIVNALKALRRVIDKGYECNFDWYGDTYDEDYVRQVEEKVRELNLTDKFNLKGESKKIAEVLPRYDIFFFPSLLEGYPNVLCEAMACGLPVVSSSACEMPNILQDGKGGYLFNPESVEEIAEALSRVISLTSEKIAEMGAFNRSFIEANNSPKSVIDKYLNLL